MDYLYEHLLESKKGDFCIYNGACPGYSSSQELLKLERDCLVLKPTMVIILNGVIDAMNTGVQEGYPFFTRFEFDIIKKYLHEKILRLSIMTYYQYHLKFLLE